MQATREGVHARHAGARGEHVVRDLGPGDRGPRLHRRPLDIVVDALAEHGMDLPPVVAPRELRHELLGILRPAHPGQRHVSDLGEPDHAMTNPR